MIGMTRIEKNSDFCKLGVNRTMDQQKSTNPELGRAKAGSVQADIARARGLQRETQGS